MHCTRTPSLRLEIYQTKVKVRGYTIKVSPLSADATTAGRLLRLGFSGWTKADHLKASDGHARAAIRIEKLYSRLLDTAAVYTWGRHYQITDYRISGIASDEFSEKFKRILRRTTWALTQHKTLAVAHRRAAGKRK